MTQKCRRTRKIQTLLYLGAVFVCLLLIPLKSSSAQDAPTSAQTAATSALGGSIPGVGGITGAAGAAGAPCCSCVCNCVNNAHAQTRAQISSLFATHQQWILSDLWYSNVLPAMMHMTTQLSAVAMQQVQIIGTFMDAEMQLETQQLLQKLQAEAHKDYHPSEGLCSIGTGVKSLAASERMAELSAAVLSKRMIDRQLRNANTAGMSPAKDIASRTLQFQKVYCNKQDYGGSFASICSANDPTSVNKDIDFTRAIDIPLTLDINFADNTTAGHIPSNAERDVLAMSTNLFGNQIASSEFDLNDPGGKQNFLAHRALTAKRNVAQNSYNTLIGMKSAGSGLDPAKLYAILEELGVEDTEARAILGDNPSYYAQMELLTKKVFQNPSFYINLYDKPANVDRKAVALQALQLMLMNDTFNSNLRTEMLMSLLLENEIELRMPEIQGRK